MAAVLAYTLPTMQLVCHLVTLSPSGNNVTDSVPGTIQPSPRIQAAALPEGYTAFPDLGFAYKYHECATTWIEARDRCRREGAVLAVIESLKKMEYIGRLRPLQWLHAGIYKSDNNETWNDANTGEPIKDIFWAPHEPVNNGRCLQFRSSPQGLANWNCDQSEAFFCQIPISLDSKISVN